MGASLLAVLVVPPLVVAGLESSYVALRRNVRPIGLLAVGLPLATTFAVEEATLNRA